MNFFYTHTLLRNDLYVYPDVEGLVSRADGVYDYNILRQIDIVLVDFKENFFNLHKKYVSDC